MIGTTLNQTPEASAQFCCCLQMNLATQVCSHLYVSRFDLTMMVQILAHGSSIRDHRILLHGTRTVVLAWAVTVWQAVVGTPVLGILMKPGW